MSKIEHISQFGSMEWEFLPNSELISTLVARDGTEVEKRNELYQINGDVLRVGDLHFRYVINNDVLVVTVVEAQNKENMGITMEFKRKQ